MTFDLKDYVEVSERIAAWYSRYEQGRIVPEILDNGYASSVVCVKASVYRGIDPDEPPAGVGHSSLAIPGVTPYTKGSELENAETSAVGRALVMAGIPAKSVASAGEVKSKQGPITGPATGNPTTVVVDPPSTTPAPTLPGVATCPHCGSDAISAFDQFDNPLNPGWFRCASCTRKVKEADVAVSA